MPSGVVAVGVWDCGAGAPMAGVLPYGRTVKIDPGAHGIPPGSAGGDLEAPVAGAGERHRQVVEAGAIADIEELCPSHGRDGVRGVLVEREEPHLGWARSPTTTAGSGGPGAGTRAGSVGRRRSGC